MTHTPTPWVYVRNPENTRWIIDDASGRAIACTAGYEPDNEANAAFIAHAVNSHSDLVEALRAVEAAMIRGGDGRILDVGWNITKLNEARPLIHAQLTKARSLPHEQH